MAGTDFKRTLDSYRAKAGEVRFVEVPELTYLMIDGAGDPNTAPAFAESVATLYPVAYALKFHSKRALERDYVVPPLEGLWDVVSGAEHDRERWTRTLLLMVPDWLDEEAYAAAVETAAAKGSAPRLAQLRLERLAGRHHEVYLSDLRRTAPEKLRTILRQPVVSG